MKNRTRRCPPRSIVLAGLFWLCGSPALPAAEGIQQRRVSLGAHSLYKPKGIGLGGFRLFPQFISANVYDDNIFYSNLDKKSDFIFHLRPALELVSEWSKHALALSVVSDLAYHARFQSENWQDYFINLSGRLDSEGNSSRRYDLSRNSYATARFYHGRLHEDRGDPDGAGGIHPVVYFKTGGKAGYQHTFNRFSLNLSNETYHLDYEDGISVFGAPIPNHLRNRLYNVTTAEAGYFFRPGLKAFIGGNYNFTDYDQPNDFFSLDRSSTGYQAVTGIALDLTGKLIGYAYVGYLYKNYKDPQLLGLNDVTGGFSLTWFLSGLTTIKSRLDRIPQETTQGFASGSLRTSLKLEINHELLRNLIINIQGGYAVDEYIGSSSPTGSTPPRNDRYYTAGLRVKYLLNRYSFLECGYDFNGRTSNTPFNDYDINRVFLSIGLQL